MSMRIYRENRRMYADYNPAVWNGITSKLDEIKKIPVDFTTGIFALL